MMLRNFLVAFVFFILSIWVVSYERIFEQGYLKELVGSLSVKQVSLQSNSQEADVVGHEVASNHNDTKDGSSPTASNAPLFVLHIGPPKTGTSTIQGYAREHLEILEQDNFYFLGHNTQRNDTRLHELSKFCRKCDLRHLCHLCSQRWKEFELVVQQHLNKNHNVFVSDETLNRFFTDEPQHEQTQLWDRLEPILKNWNVRIIYSYRRYYDWLPSTYYQSFNPNEQREQWPDRKGGAGPIPTFPDFLQNWIGGQGLSTTIDGKQPSWILRKWQEHFDNVLIFSMHQHDEFITAFYCHMIPKAKHICNHLQNRTNTITRNPSSSKQVHYDMLAVAAYKKGWIDKKLTRAEVADAVEKECKRKGLLSVSDFPMHCPTQQQHDVFLNLSLDLEAEMIKDSSSSLLRTAEMKQYYSDSIKSRKFCSVDTDSVLQDEAWQRFFHGLGATSIDDSKSKSKEEIEKDSSKMIASKKNRPSPILCLYTGDEGSTVLSEALRLHPQVYSPDWGVEPANARNWKKEEFNLRSQLDAIRFLLRIPSNTTNFTHWTKKGGLSIDAYKRRVGGADATYLKAAVCRKEKDEAWTTCMKQVVTNLLCGKEGDTVKHLILPVRYGFDRACSIFVHRDAELYKKYSQFSDIKSSISANSTFVTMPEKKAIELRKGHEHYVSNFMQVLELTKTTCPSGQQNKPKIHVFDYEHAKEVGIEKALRNMLTDLGLRHDAKDLNLGRFNQRKPGNYCERIFDKKSKELLLQQEATYKTWLKGSCKEDDGSFPWCK